MSGLPYQGSLIICVTDREMRVGPPCITCWHALRSSGILFRGVGSIPALYRILVHNEGNVIPVLLSALIDRAPSSDVWCRPSLSAVFPFHHLFSAAEP